MFSITESLKSLIATSQHSAGEYTGLTFLYESYIRQHGPATFLNRMFTGKAYISTDSFDADFRSFEIIGEGQCGTVWALTGTDQVLKVMKEGKLDQLWNDSVMHKTVQEAFETVGIALRNDITIPKYGQYITPRHDVFWQPNIKRFSAEITDKHAFLSSRIFGLPLSVRASIVDTLAPKDIRAHKQEFLAREENQHTLVRLYLGRREQRAATRSFRLRNFDLTISEMEYLRLDTHRYATIIARALAILHWRAHVDANDVEFVLGSAPMISTPPTAAELKILNPDNIGFVTHGLNLYHTSVGCWLLDFDQCQSFEKDAAGLELLKKGFWMNDPYYPRPVSTNAMDMALWAVFKEEYLAASGILTDSGMPKDFITAVEAEGKRRQLGGSIFQ
ncbi:MAG: hypothetical protein LQ341_004813 [Variospora aurantia]|nr:MAG: hypothetical protein LQ341_004813 [Variospora aurantia]